MRRPYDDIVVAAPVSLPYERFSIETMHWWAGAALRGLVEASGISHKDMDGLALSSFTAGTDSGVNLVQHLGMTVRFLDTVPLGGAAGTVSLRRAARAVEAGDADVVACIAADTNHPDTFRQSLANFSRFAQDAVYPFGAGGANGSFALLTRNYMNRFGATREDFARICIDQRSNAGVNPRALLRKPLSLDEYMNARLISDPLHLFDCVMPCAGAEAFLVMREETAKAQGLAYAKLTSSIERHHAYPEDPIQIRGGWARDVDELYAMAGCTPDDIDVVQTYDDYPVIAMMQFEDLGFCAKGEGPEFVRSKDMTIAGDFPQNTTGGQLSSGQAGAAGGHMGLVENIRQLTDAAGPSQVKDASRALALGFGMINYDRGLASSAVILERA
ncbi:thiolase family protein [Celeribacter sp.]|uniref:thiolase family protein n=1 Tax=Celeribacter sp. TaxID=1890673 RepID=UPI003A8FA005